MFDDPFYSIGDGEIFQKSNCMRHERTLVDFFESMLTMMGYTKTNNYRVWQRDQRQVVICLADDFNVCRKSWTVPPEEYFDASTKIITDNHSIINTPYQVYQLPESYFGVFNYVPADQVYRPNRRFNFSVNRLDAQRELILLELTAQSENILEQDYINFNCWDASGNNSSVEDIQHNFLKYWNQLEPVQHNYESIVHPLVNQIPLRNHQLSVELAQISAYLNLVVETYAGDTTITFSEKIFRALVTPAPWTLYAAKSSVVYLKTMGFDVLDDIVDHGYNLVTQDDSPCGIKKIRAYIKSSIETYNQLQAMDFDVLQSRCLQAAQHNQRRISQLQQQWPEEFARWLPDVLLELKTGK